MNMLVLLLVISLVLALPALVICWFVTTDDDFTLVGRNRVPGHLPRPRQASEQPSEHAR